MKRVYVRGGSPTRITDRQRVTKRLVEGAASGSRIGALRKDERLSEYVAEPLEDFSV